MPCQGRLARSRLLAPALQAVTGPAWPRGRRLAWLSGCGRTVTLAPVRLTEFWARMRQQFGDAYADSVAADQVLSDLGSRTVNQALADGVEVKRIWLAVCEAFRVPERQR